MLEMSYWIIFCNIYILPPISISLLSKFSWNIFHPTDVYYKVAEDLYLLITIINIKILSIKSNSRVMLNIYNFQDIL